MHSSSFDIECGNRDGGDVLVAIAALVTEGRIPGKSSGAKSRGFYEGPHCAASKTTESHYCNPDDYLCQKYESVKSEVLNLWQKGIPLCVEVLLRSVCGCNQEDNASSDIGQEDLLLEQWYFSLTHYRSSEISTPFNINQLISAVRSQLHFSQISAWLSTQISSKISNNNLKYRLTVPGESFEQSKFTQDAIKHNFPCTQLGNGLNLNLSLLSLPRMSNPPIFNCQKCEQTPPQPPPPEVVKPEMDETMKWMLDDRMHTNCTLKGKHRCEDFDEVDLIKKECKYMKSKRVCHSSCSKESSCSSSHFISEPSTSSSKPKLLIDVQKAESYRPKQFDQPLNVSEKRNSSPNVEESVKTPKLDLKLSRYEIQEVMSVLRNENKDKSNLSSNKHQNKGDILLNAILRSCRLQNDENLQNDKSTNFYKEVDNKNEKCDVKCVQKLGQIGSSILNGCAKALQSVSDTNSLCDMRGKSDIFNIKNKINIYVDSDCDTPVPKNSHIKMRDISNVEQRIDTCFKGKTRQKITFDDDQFKTPNSKHLKTCDKDDALEPATPTATAADGSATDKLSNINNNGIEIPTSIEQAKFRKSLDNAASMVFHSRTGLPLTSSPAPVRRGKSCFDYDSSINSVSAIKSALFSASFSTDDDSESDGSIVSPCSPDTYIQSKKQPSPVKQYRRGHSCNLLGSFEESVLNGRLEPVSTVHGFKAELGASGSFVPRHLVVPVTVFFYTLVDNDKVSSPYLGHINLGKKGYNVPKTGTVQVTLFNPLGTVVKMFVIMYDLSDMPPNSLTFIRQRTLYMPTNCQDKNLEWGPKWLRYLIHLRFMSSKSGRIYLHSDIRMIIFRKSDMDTATGHGIDMCYELRSFTHMPINPKYSPRK